MIVTANGSAYGHRVWKTGSFNTYMMTWTIDYKFRGNRLRWPRTFRRYTDEAGARRFAKKWDTPLPENLR